MVDKLIVPVDGSKESWRAFDTALSLAKACNGHIDVVQVASDPADSADIERAMQAEVQQRDLGDVPVRTGVELAMFGVVAKLTALVRKHPGATVVIASHGRGRSAALVGSVTEELLQTTFGPLLVVGPHATTSDFSGPIVVSVDGSRLSEFAVPLATAWGIELGATAWIVQVIDPEVQLPADVNDSAYTVRLAHDMRAKSGREVQSDVLHGKHPANTITEYATGLHAGVIVAGTHGRTGAARFAVGSTAANIVRHATCPVLLVRPPHFTPSEPSKAPGDHR